ncbi:hypothetical protein H2199_008011 [Coniosporium tulheliwenetii]|uniref:Uncharacterized protein n=1 Tax=Coniosporium tulheliwenetii TaxID=3383036 RepID=A0ACC2YM61_9PEZI|nr:hypothetical protein H2199_008011 [Cladosporium sp. JES 115]
MDRPINPPHLSSVSTPTLHPPYNTSTSTPPPTIDPRNNFLHRNHTDGTTRAPLSPSERAEGETWMDFLRRTSASNSTAAPAAAADSRPDHQPLIPRQRPDIHMNSVRDLNEAHNALIAERKRRLTAPDSPERSRRLSGTSAGAASGSQVAGPGASSEAAGRGVPGGSVGMPIDLTETPDRSSRRTSHPRRQSREAGRRESDIVLPPWQPDSELREEDECPVCGMELPPKAADGSNVAAEAHIDACIKQHVSGTSVPRDAAHPPPNAGGPTSAENGSEEASASRPRRDMRFKIRKDRATEKDCLREDGEAQECVICFEEFVVGDELGTLPCFCKFHHACIMSWWSTKGPGSCPTHQLRH